MWSDTRSSICGQWEFSVRSAEEMAKSMVEPCTVVGTWGSLMTAESISWFMRVVPVDVKLPPLLEDYKNPCWMEKVPPQFTYEHSFFKECNHKSRGTTQKDNLDIFYNMNSSKNCTANNNNNNNNDDDGDEEDDDDDDINDDENDDDDDDDDNNNDNNNDDENYDDDDDDDDNNNSNDDDENENDDDDNNNNINDDENDDDDDDDNNSKSGTTDLFVTLKTYSKYLSPVYLKEPHYWEWKRCHDRMVCKGKHRNPTFAEYLDTLDPASERIRLETTVLEHGTEYHPLIIGDFTPSTLTFHPCWTNQAGNIDREEPLYMTAHYIRSIRPDAKFIVMMRDPVERIFSNYKMKFRLSKRLGQENAQLFHEEMLNATTYLTNCMLHQTARSCAYSVMKFDYMTHVTNSMYEIFIRDWLAVFPRDQFLFLRMEDYMESRVPNVKAIFEFLGLGKTKKCLLHDI
ncbi:hypothetical protein LSH36_406g02080 [Paralvinella palmiformis]|uniref:Sulfotransferase domain-containing protein n=1 Tax=Paralvinella palmiformis TaxID=53620 RepID=A0AAD9JD40_9ANNE|nr:hypothetical protein LSH36_406g02080 [Paralvinella palmiformis]